MRSRTCAAPLAALLTAVVLAACGGGSSSSTGNGVASKSATEILADASKAAQSLSSVHILGTSVSSTQPLMLDLTLAGKDGEGTISENGLSFRIKSVGSYLYINASASFWQHFGNATAAKLFADKWLKAPATGQFASLAALTDKQEIFTQMLAHQGQLSKGKTSTVNGQPVIALTDTSKGGGTLYIATTGKPYPIEIANSGTSGGHILFDQFNAPVTVTAPAKTVDLSQLK